MRMNFELTIMKNKKIKGLLGYTLHLFNWTGAYVVWGLVGKFLAFHPAKRLRWLRLLIGAFFWAIAINSTLALLHCSKFDIFQCLIAIVLSCGIAISFEWIKDELQEDY